MDRSESRNYSRGSTDRQIDMKENNGSEESQKKDLFNKKVDLVTWPHYKHILLRSKEYISIHTNTELSAFVHLGIVLWLDQLTKLYHNSEIMRLASMNIQPRLNSVIIWPICLGPETLNKYNKSLQPIWQNFVSWTISYEHYFLFLKWPLAQ